MRFWIIPYVAVKEDLVLDKIKENFLYIYFRSPGMGYKQIELNDKCINSVEIWCEDVSPEKNYDKNIEHVWFNEQHAKNIVECVKNNLDKVNLIVCQCDAGISRSAAVVCALDECVNGGGKSKIWDNERWFPNEHIYDIIMKVWNEI
jgi:protein-tyrosine phosphatase